MQPKRRSIPTLSKSKYLAGLQCSKRLYFECYQQDLASPINPSTQGIIDTGRKVGEVARKRFPDGLLIEEHDYDFTAALEDTMLAIGARNTCVFFEPAFEYDNVKIRADILRRVGNNQYDLIEVKSTTSAKPEHEYDLAIQMYVLEGCGMQIRKALLMHLNTDYIFDGAEYDFEQLFEMVDLTDNVRYIHGHMGGGGRHCHEPFACPFYDHCNAHEYEYPVSELPRIRREIVGDLKEAGVEEIRDIPPGYPHLSPLQNRVRSVVVSESPYFNPEIKTVFSKLKYPLHFLDFETFAPALPLYQGASPYQTIPFQ